MLACTSSARQHEKVEAAQAQVVAPSSFVTEPQSWQEQAMWVLTNRVRVDPVAALAPCAEDGTCADHGCYTEPLNQMVWDARYALAARFHATFLQQINAGLPPRDLIFEHQTGCQLKESIKDDFAATGCATARCACESEPTLAELRGFSKRCPAGVSNQYPNRECCNAAAIDDGKCMQVLQRLRAFGLFPRSASENNYRGASDALQAINRLLHEPASSSSCGRNGENGHRWAMLRDDVHLFSAGFAPSIGEGAHFVQGLEKPPSRTARPEHGIIAGVHYPDDTSVTVSFYVNWWSKNTGAEPSKRVLNLDGVCYEGLELDRGEADDGTYRVALRPEAYPNKSCIKYRFEFEDRDGTFTYPASGSLQLGSECTSHRTTENVPECGQVVEAECDPSVEDCRGRTEPPPDDTAPAVNADSGEDGAPLPDNRIVSDASRPQTAAGGQKAGGQGEVKASGCGITRQSAEPPWSLLLLCGLLAQQRRRRRHLV